MATRPLRPDDDFDPATAALLLYHARRLVRGSMFRKGEMKEARQELSARLLERLAKHDPARSSAWTFRNCVAKSASSDLAREARAQKRDPRRERPLGGVLARELGLLREPEWRVEWVDVRLDVTEALEGLPADARHVAGLLMVFNEAEAARRAKMSRQRVRTLRRVIERHLSERGLP
jgi:hypothetical protein